MLKKELRSREYFGEIAILNNFQRPSTCVAKFRTFCLVISLKNYSSSISLRVDIGFSSDIAKIIKNVPFLKNISIQKLSDLVGKSIVQRYSSDEILLKEGENTKYLWIIKKGHV